eukprot:3916561-Amphidinium_carterae.1
MLRGVVRPNDVQQPYYKKATRENAYSLNSNLQRLSHVVKRGAWHISPCVFFHPAKGQRPYGVPLSMSAYCSRSGVQPSTLLGRNHCA